MRESMSRRSSAPRCTMAPQHPSSSRRCSRQSPLFFSPAGHPNSGSIQVEGGGPAAGITAAASRLRRNRSAARGRDTRPTARRAVQQQQLQLQLKLQRSMSLSCSDCKGQYTKWLSSSMSAPEQEQERVPDDFMRRTRWEAASVTKSDKPKDIARARAGARAYKREATQARKDKHHHSSE
jgi:hypothetical protein